MELKLWIFPDRQGGWRVKDGGGSSPASRHDTREEAEREAERFLAERRYAGEIMIADADGRVQEVKRWSPESG